MRAALVGLVAAALIGAATPADATVGELGHDVSYPQCGGVLPATGVFGIVGVTNGLPFSVSPCLATQGAWAVATGEPMLYTNTANPGPASSNWPKQPVGRCTTPATNNAGCAYEYGKKAATDALTKAKTALSGVLDPTKVTWWLDVEGSRTPGQPGNSWVGSGVVNAADLQGFADGLRAGGVREVGVYSTAFQWDDITQGYTRSTSNSYRTSWGFPVASPIEDGPVWFAGVGTVTDAASRCATASFTGGQRLLAQYADGAYDGDRRCADPDVTAPQATVKAPTSPVTLALSFGGAWSGTDTGGSGLATYDVRTTKASAGGPFSAWQLPAGLQRTATTSASFSGTGQGWTTCVAARSRDAAGNVSPWVPSRCTTVPLDDRALAASSGWTRAAASGWFASTYSVTTRQYATLVRTGLVSSRLTLVAQRCSTCGKVGVYVGSTLLATVDLHASSTYRAVIALPRFSLRTTGVTLKVLTSGKPVRVDALASSRV